MSTIDDLPQLSLVLYKRIDIDRWKVAFNKLPKNNEDASAVAGTYKDFEGDITWLFKLVRRNDECLCYTHHFVNKGQEDMRANIVIPRDNNKVECIYIHPFVGSNVVKAPIARREPSFWGSIWAGIKKAFSSPAIVCERAEPIEESKEHPFEIKTIGQFPSDT